MHAILYGQSDLSMSKYFWPLSFCKSFFVITISMPFAAFEKLHIISNSRVYKSIDYESIEDEYRNTDVYAGFLYIRQFQEQGTAERNFSSH